MAQNKLARLQSFWLPDPSDHLSLWSFLTYKMLINVDDISQVCFQNENKRM